MVSLHLHLYPLSRGSGCLAFECGRWVSVVFLLSSLLGCVCSRVSRWLCRRVGNVSLSLLLSVFVVVPVVGVSPAVVGSLGILHFISSRRPFSGPPPIECLPVDTLSMVCYLKGTVVPVRSTGGLIPCPVC